MIYLSAGFTSCVKTTLFSMVINSVEDVAGALEADKQRHLVRIMGKRDEKLTATHCLVVEDAVCE